MAQAPATLERKPICLDGALPFSRAQGNARPAYLPVQEPVGDLKLPSAGFAGVAGSLKTAGQFNAVGRVGGIVKG